MTIKLIAAQVCDGCEKSREIVVESLKSGVDLEELAKREGWREVRTNKHICPSCISKALGI